MRSKNGCPFCLENVIYIVEAEPPKTKKGFQVLCDNCGARGPIYKTKDEAIEGWELGIKGTNGRMRKI